MPLRWRSSVLAIIATRTRPSPCLSCRSLAFKRSTKRLLSATRFTPTLRFQADLARWNAKLLMTSPMPQYNIVGTGDPRASLADFKGMAGACNRRYRQSLCCCWCGPNLA